MCGICGVVSPDRSAPPLASRELERMRDRLTHRGPDDAGTFVAAGVALAARRLAILDLSVQGRMPMSDRTGRYRIVYNGEVYNHRELRAELTARGHRFHSQTDTETVLEGWTEWGPAMLPRLNGMFAFAVWDERERALTLVRDRLGIKPLYYARRGGGLAFASEPKALAAAGVAPRFDPDLWSELVAFRYAAGERTPLAGVLRLLPGHWLRWSERGIETRRWWNLAERARELRAKPPVDPAAWYRETFDDAVALRRLSDVPLGVLLSGGLDSSSVAASLAARAGAGVASFTVTFPDRGHDEGPLARQVAARWQLDPHELPVAAGEVLDRLEEATRLYDEPLVHGNDVHLLAIARYAKPRVTVLLSGEGGDETLGGYVRYLPLRHPRWLAAIRPLAAPFAGGSQTSRLLPPRLAKLARFLALDAADGGGGWDRFVLWNACDVLPAELAALGMDPAAAASPPAFREEVLAEARALHPDEPVRQAMYVDHRTFLGSLLDRNDRMTMGASIECRVPFLDHRLVEGLAALPSRHLFAGRDGKPLLRRSLGDRLPAAVLRHRKWGFGAPWNDYLRRDRRLREALAALPETPPVESGPFDRRRLREAVGAFLDRDDDRHLALLRQLLMIALWHRHVVAAPAFRTDDAPAPAAAVAPLP